MAFCMNCGKELPNGAKFCLECGTKLGDIKENQTAKRETTYEGTIYRCPNCGDILGAYESICKSCGYERRGTKATNSSQELCQKLQEIEMKRPANKRTVLRDPEAEGEIISKTDQQFFFMLIEEKKADNMAKQPFVLAENEVLDKLADSARRIIAENSCLKLADLTVNGNDMISIGIEGKEIGIILNKLLGLVVDEELPNDKTILLSYTKEKLT